MTTEAVPDWALTDNDIQKIKSWAATQQGPGGQAAVWLLTEHDHWLHHEKFVRTCVHRNGGEVYVDFGDVRELWRQGTYGSDGQLAILLVIADLGSSRWPLGVMDVREHGRVVRAVAQAASYSLPEYF
jgi:hypothetical protein